MAVYSKNPNVDAIGSCIGNNSSRINVIVNEIRGEKIDIINWSESPKKYISEALKPCNVTAIELNEEERIAKVVVPNDQLSLGIGKEGQNVRLAARLTGWKIDIKNEEQAKATNFIDFENKEVYLKENEDLEQHIEEDNLLDNNLEEDIDFNDKESYIDENMDIDFDDIEE